MNVRPQDLPELRAEMTAYNQSPEGIAAWGRREFFPASEVVDSDGTILVCDPSPEERRSFETSRLEKAELFFVSAEMGRLATAAGASLPSFRVEEFDLPSPYGFMIFEEPIDSVSDDGVSIPICGVSWSTAYNAELGTDLWLSWYTDTHSIRSPWRFAGPRFHYTQDSEWSFGRGNDAVPDEDSELFNWGRAVVAAWLLMQQPLARVSEVEPDRAARKRLRRAGSEPSAVRVITLRRPKTGGESGPGDREYHHQWIVRGHWRNHWHPKRQVHRPVWIAPHIKGPEGAPLIGGEKVYALKR